MQPLLRPLVAISMLTIAASIGNSAEPSRPVARGKEQAIPIPFIATNESPSRMACTAALAHWFSAELGEAAPGESVKAMLWFDPATGEVALLNAKGDRMPVEALWCGIAGRSWPTRSVILLQRRAGAPPPPISLACAEDGGRLSCR